MLARRRFSLGGISRRKLDVGLAIAHASFLEISLVFPGCLVTVESNGYIVVHTIVREGHAKKERQT